MKSPMLGVRVLLGTLVEKVGCRVRALGRRVAGTGGGEDELDAFVSMVREDVRGGMTPGEAIASHINAGDLISRFKQVDRVFAGVDFAVPGSERTSHTTFVRDSTTGDLKAAEGCDTCGSLTEKLYPHARHEGLLFCERCLTRRSPVHDLPPQVELSEKAKRMVAEGLAPVPRAKPDDRPVVVTKRVR